MSSQSWAEAGLFVRLPIGIGGKRIENGVNDNAQGAGLCPVCACSCNNTELCIVVEAKKSLPKPGTAVAYSCGWARGCGLAGRGVGWASDNTALGPGPNDCHPTTGNVNEMIHGIRKVWMLGWDDFYTLDHNIIMVPVLRWH